MIFLGTIFLTLVSVSCVTVHLKAMEEAQAQDCENGGTSVPCKKAPFNWNYIEENDGGWILFTKEPNVFSIKKEVDIINHFAKILDLEKDILCEIPQGYRSLIDGIQLLVKKDVLDILNECLDLFPCKPKDEAQTFYQQYDVVGDYASHPMQMCWKNEDEPDGWALFIKRNDIFFIKEQIDFINRWAARYSLGDKIKVERDFGEVFFGRVNYLFRPGNGIRIYVKTNALEEFQRSFAFAIRS